MFIYRMTTPPCNSVVRARHDQATTAPAACERQALDGVAAFGEAMKCVGVKRLRQRSGHTRIGAKAEGGFIAFCALSDYHCDSEGAGLAGFIASAVTERSDVFRQPVTSTLVQVGLIDC